MEKIDNETYGKEHRERKKSQMEEKVYKTMSGSGAFNIAIGVVLLVVGIASGVLMIVSGAKLLSAKSKILF